MKARSKYRAVPTVVDGIRFDSKKEAKRYAELRLMEKAKNIWRLRLQPDFPIVVNGQRLGLYKADFAYFEMAGGETFGPEIVEDCKGYRTDVYRLKKKLVEAIYGIKVLET